jgi:hypothetical protein
MWSRHRSWICPLGIHRIGLILASHQSTTTRLFKHCDKPVLAFKLDWGPLKYQTGGREPSARASKSLSSSTWSAGKRTRFSRFSRVHLTLLIQEHKASHSNEIIFKPNYADICKQRLLLSKPIARTTPSWKGNIISVKQDQLEENARQRPVFARISLLWVDVDEFNRRGAGTGRGYVHLRHGLLRHRIQDSLWR